MSRKIMVCSGVLALALALPMTAAQAGPWTVHVGAGASVPVGDFGDKDKVDAQTGFQFGGGVDYRFNDMFSVGVDGSWNRNTHGGEGDTFGTFKLEEDRFTTWQVGANGKYFIPVAGNLSPYVIGGLGVYNTTEKWEGVDSVTGPESGEVKTDSRFGFKAGVGATFKVNEMIGVGVEGNYNFITQDKDKVSVDNLQYLGLSGALIFNLMQ